jgi:putative flippase GtrA
VADAAGGRGPLQGQALRFLLAGGANTAFTYALFWLLAAWLHHQLAFAIAFVVGVGVAYRLNTRFVFGVRGGTRSAVGYPLVYLATYALNSLLLEAGVALFGWTPRWALLPAIAVGVPVSFMLNRWWLARHAEAGRCRLSATSPSPCWRWRCSRPGSAMRQGWPGTGWVMTSPTCAAAFVNAEDGQTLARLYALLGRSVSEGAAFFRPAIIASFAVDFARVGADYRGWFAHNLVLHLANMAVLAWLLGRLARQAGLRAGLAAPLAAALFGLSPLLAEGVYWVSARSDASVTLLALLGLGLWVGRPDAPARAAWLPLLMLPALLFKESAVLLPLQATLLWLASPALRERRRGVALIAAFVLAAAFMAWRAHLFGDALQVYGGDSGAGPTAKALAAIASLPAWARGLAGGNAALIHGYLGLLGLALALALALAPARALVLALAAAGAGGLLATFINLGALLDNGEGGRLFYTPMAFLAMAYGLGCAAVAGATHRACAWPPSAWAPRQPSSASPHCCPCCRASGRRSRCCARSPRRCPRRRAKTPRCCCWCPTASARWSRCATARPRWCCRRCRRARCSIGCCRRFPTNSRCATASMRTDCSIAWRRPTRSQGDSTPACRTSPTPAPAGRRGSDAGPRARVAWSSSTHPRPTARPTGRRASSPMPAGTAACSNEPGPQGCAHERSDHRPLALTGRRGEAHHVLHVRVPLRAPSGACASPVDSRARRRAQPWKAGPAPRLDLSPSPGDEVKHTTCYMCACRCGIKVWLRTGRSATSRAIPSTRSTAACSAPRARPGSCSTTRRRGCRSRCCGWASAAAASSARSNGTRRWTWPPTGCAPIRERNPDELAFFTGRDQSQALTGWWAQQFGTINYAAHGGFCSVNMAAGGLYTLGGSFWEFGEPDWEHSRYLMLWGVAEDHDSNPIKLGLGKLKGRGAKIVAVNPVRRATARSPTSGSASARAPTACSRSR